MEEKKTRKRLQANAALRQIITDFYAEGQGPRPKDAP